MPSAGDVVGEFLSAWTAGETDRAIALVDDDYSLWTPAQESAGEGARDELAAYIGHIAPFCKGCRMLRQWEDGEDVSSIVQLLLEPPTGPMTLTISEWDRVRDGKICSSRLIFDTTAAQGSSRQGGAVDPVCHMRVEPATSVATRRHGDKLFFFCSIGCAERFEAGPERYLAHASH